MPLDLKVHRDFEACLRPLSNVEFTQLSENCQREGRVRDPIIYWVGPDETCWIAEGMHRYKIAIEHNIPYEARPTAEAFSTADDVCAWILTNQLGRRNHSPDDDRLARGRLAELMGAIGSNSGPKTGAQAAQEKVGKMAGVSPRTVRRDAKYAAEWNSLGPAIQEQLGNNNIERSVETVSALAGLPVDARARVVKDVVSGKSASIAKRLASPCPKTPKRKVAADETTYMPRNSDSVEDPVHKCPNCQCTWWRQAPDEDGYSCDRCLHPFGEPVGDIGPTVDVPAGDLEQAKQTSDHEQLIKRMRAAASVLARGFSELNVTEFDDALDGVYGYLAAAVLDAMTKRQAGGGHGESHAT